MLRASIRSGKKRPMLQAATGFGKTLVAAEMVRSAVAKGKRAVFIVDAISLVDQALEAFFDHGIERIGVMQGDHPMHDPDAPVQIVSVQTIQRRSWKPAADLVLVDEAHGLHQWLCDVMAAPEWEKVPFIGLSATPWAKGLGNHYDDLIQPIGMQELIDLGYLCPFRVFAPSDPDLSGVRTMAGEYHEGQLSGVMQQEGLIADVVQTWLKLGEWRPTLIFGVDRAHAKKLQQRFIEAGVGCGYIDAYTERDERLAIKGQLDRREIHAVANVGTLVKGADWSLGCIVDAAPTKSKIRHVQKIGRGLRVNPDAGPDLILLDHAGNIGRLGFPTDIHLDAMCTKVKGEKSTEEAETIAPLPKPCSKCNFMKPAKVHTCPACGFKPEPVSKIEEQEGELVEVKRKGKKAEPTPAEKEHFYRELLTLREERKKGANWADGFFKAKFGHWPARKHGLAPLTPTLETLGFVKSRQIAFSKGRRAAR